MMAGVVLLFHLFNSLVLGRSDQKDCSIGAITHFNWQLNILHHRAAAGVA